MLGLIQGARIDTDMYVTGVTLAEDETGLDVTVEIGSEERDGVPVEEIKRDLFTRLIARPDTQVRLRLDQPPIRRVLARVADVPAYGWQAFTPVPLVQPVRAEHVGTDVTLSNGATTVV